MTGLRLCLLAAAAVVTSAPAIAAEPAVPGIAIQGDGMPSLLNSSERSQYRLVFAAIEAGNWSEVAARLDGMREGPLHHVARAELYLAAGSPRVELHQILPLLASAPDIPKAAQLARLAETRGATGLPRIAQPGDLRWAGSQPRRARPDHIKGDPAADALEPLVQELIVDDRPTEAEALFQGRESQLSPAARTEFLQRIAWSYYITGNDNSALRLATEAARRGSGEWALHAEWVAGLAAWRMGDCNRAGQSFASVGANARDVELMAAGYYWAARADMMCGYPERVQARLRNAARLRETFYGILSATALGIATRNFSQLHDYRDSEWRDIADKPNVRAAIALTEIGETGLAGEYIRHQARLGGAKEHDALIHLAGDLNLASTQYWLAHNAPRGADVNIAARYPMPDWRPPNGWRVDKSLLYAHALQESGFRTEVVSPAGAYGVMQVRPGSAGDIARSRGQSFSAQQLFDPNVNIEYGQSYLEYLRDYPGTDGLLPKVMAAYNAGPSPVTRWNHERFGGGDPLLYIESIPYWETRGYVPIVLRNYWIYEQKADKPSTSREALAQGLWPKFPGMPGPTAVRLSGQADGRARGTH